MPFLLQLLHRPPVCWLSMVLQTRQWLKPSMVLPTLPLAHLDPLLVTSLRFWRHIALDTHKWCSGSNPLQWSVGAFMRYALSGENLVIEWEGVLLNAEYEQIAERTS